MDVAVAKEMGELEKSLCKKLCVRSGCVELICLRLSSQKSGARIQRTIPEDFGRDKK
jgi:hypothetical protein